MLPLPKCSWRQNRNPPERTEVQKVFVAADDDPGPGLKRQPKNVKVSGIPAYRGVDGERTFKTAGAAEKVEMRIDQAGRHFEFSAQAGGEFLEDVLAEDEIMLFEAVLEHGLR